MSYPESVYERPNPIISNFSEKLPHCVRSRQAPGKYNKQHAQTYGLTSYGQLMRKARQPTS
eukprot:scaffold136421_cov31-Tisochrysis_lutea.AAC.1